MTNKFIKPLRIVLVIPAVILGEILAVIVTAIWNAPLTFLETYSGLFGNWNLWGLVFGGPDMTIDILYGISSGIFLSAIGLYLGISVFPYAKHRNKIAYFLIALLLVGFSSSTQMEVPYNNAYYFYSKIIGVIIGSWVVLHMLRVHKDRGLFNFIDRMIDKDETS